MERDNTLLIFNTPEGHPNLFLIPNSDITDLQRKHLETADGYYFNHPTEIPPRESLERIDMACLDSDIDNEDAINGWDHIWWKFRLNRLSEFPIQRIPVETISHIYTTGFWE